MTTKPEALRYPHHYAQELGQDYINHVMSMTSEKLHSKSDIAVQLAWRDAELRRQHEEIERLKVENAAIGSLMNAYNLGGWTDSLTLLQERDKAREALRVALEALEERAGVFPGSWSMQCDKAITKIKEVLP